MVSIYEFESFKKYYITLNDGSKLNTHVFDVSFSYENDFIDVINDYQNEALYIKCLDRPKKEIAAEMLKHGLIRRILLSEIEDVRVNRN